MMTIHKLAIGVLLVLSVAGGVQTARADFIAYWNFNQLSIDTPRPPGGGIVPVLIDADEGSGILSLADWTGLVDDLDGTTLNARSGDPAEESLTLVGSNGNGSWIQIEFSMTGLRDLEVSFAGRGNISGYSDGQWTYSRDGLNYTPFGFNTATRSTTFGLVSVAESGGLNDAPTAFLRYTLSGASASTGYHRIDNLQLNATAIPEPILPWTLGLFVSGLAMTFCRRRVTYSRSR